MSLIDKDLAALARQEWPKGAHSADVLSDGSGGYYYESPAAGKYTHPQYLHARHVLGLDGEAKKETNMHPDLEWLARNVSEWPGTKYVSLYKGCVIWDREPYPGAVSFMYPQWLQARQDLGLVMSEEEAELPAEEYKRTAESFLKQAAELMKERGKQYDQPGGERSMGKTVEAFNAITGRKLSESEGWLLMGLLKSVRQYSGDYHQDSAEDKVAYAALEAESLEASALRARELGE